MDSTVVFADNILPVVEDVLLGAGDLVDKLLPVGDDKSAISKINNEKQRSDLINRYFYAPDLVDLPRNAWRVINAVSDHATHAQPLRMTKNYQENLFDKVITGHPMTDKAMKLLAAA